MAYGLQVIGSHGAIQVDDNYSNLLRIGSGVIAPGGDANRVQIACSNQGALVPQIFVRPVSDGVYVGGVLWGDGGTGGAQYTATLFCTGTVEWVAFGVYSPQALDGTGYGLQVFNGSGGLVLDSRYEVSRVQSTILIDQSPYADGLGGYNYPQTYGIPAGGWGLRPWIGLNPFMRGWGSESEQAYMVTSNGTGAITVRLADIVNNTITGWIDNHFAGINRGFLGGMADVPVLRRYSD